MAESDLLFTYPGAPGHSGTASGTAGFVTADGVGASTPFTPAPFSCAAGASSCSASLSTTLVYDVPQASRAAFVGTSPLALTSQGAFRLMYGDGAIVTGSRQSASISGTVTYTLLSDVPEPAGWATMIAGFGAVGMALRMRSRAALRLA